MSLLSLLGVDRWIDSWSERMREAMAEGTSGLEARALLVKLEWQEEKRRLQQLTILFLLCAGLTVGILMGISMAVIVTFWDTPFRVMVAWGVVLFWIVVWVVMLVLLLQVARKSRQAFELTRKELAQDWEALKERL